MLITIQEAQPGDVVGSSANWTGPSPDHIEGNDPIRVGPSTLAFESYEWYTWTADTLTATALELTFVNEGDYTVEVSLMGDRAWDGSGNEQPLLTTSYSVAVGTPVVSIPASPPWSLALLGIGALGAMAWFRRRTVISS